MQDRFKFRCWDKENKCMLYPHRYSNFCNVNGTIVKIESYPISNTAYRGKRISYEFDDASLMQCTGLKDKNGKLIYENDIVKFKFDNDVIIAVVTWDGYETGFYLNTTDYFKDKYVTDYDICEGFIFEVIGNVHENKELLNE